MNDNKHDVLLVYYSRTGTTRAVAEQLASLAGWQTGEVVDQPARAGASGDWRCILDNVLRRRADYVYQGPPLTDFSHIVLMAPVWVSRLAAPMRTFLVDHAPFPRRVSAVCTMASHGGFRAVEEISELTGQIPSPVLVLRQQDVLDGLPAHLLEDFAAQVVGSANYLQHRQRPAWLSPEAA